MKKPVYCFIDDSPLEIELMRNVIAPKETGADFVCTENFTGCRNLLMEDNIYPALFILDLYGSRGKPDPAKIPPYEELKKKTERFVSLGDVYKGLNDYSESEKVQEFLSRFFSIVHAWRTLHAEVYGRMGHDREYGKTNFLSSQKHYPLAARVFYTRKATIEDAIDVFSLEPNGFFLKPTAAEGEDIRKVTSERSGELLEQWREIVKNKYSGILAAFAGQTTGEGGMFLQSDATTHDLIDIIAGAVERDPRFTPAYLESLRAWAAYVK